MKIYSEKIGWSLLGRGQAFAFLLAFSLWLYARPYLGVRHDAVLYLGQTLNNYYKGIFSEDLFFKYGSQDSLSIYGPLSAWLMGYMSYEWLVWLCLAFSIFAYLLITLKLVDEQWRRWTSMAALALVCTITHRYGDLRVFAFAEPFLTARTLAEPIALLAVLVASSASQKGLSLIALVVAFLVHPLVAISAAGTVLILLVQSDRRWLTVLILPVLGAVAGLFDVHPFGQLYQAYDDQWWAIVTNANKHCFVSEWPFHAYIALAFNVVVTYVGYRCATGALKSVALASCLACVIGLFVSLIGVDFSRNVLLTSLQPWRVQWVTSYIAILVSPLLICKLIERGAMGWVAAVAFVSALMALSWERNWVLIAWTIVAVLLACGRVEVRAGFRVLAIFAPLAAVSFVYFKEALNVLSGPGEAASWANEFLYLVASVPVFLLMITWCFYYAWVRADRYRVVVLACVFILLVFGFSKWDRSPPFNKYMVENLGQVRPFSGLVPKGAQVYWSGGALSTWALLNTPSYYSPEQGAGAVFNRDNAMEFQKRRPAFEALGLQAALCEAFVLMGDAAADAKSCWPTDEIIREICETNRDLDFMIFDRSRRAGQVARWVVGSEGQGEGIYYLYDCSLVRRGG